MPDVLIVGDTVRSAELRHEVPLVRLEWLMALPRGEAVVRLRGEVWKLRVPLLEPPPPTILAHWGLTDMATSLQTRRPQP